MVPVKYSRMFDNYKYVVMIACTIPEMHFIDKYKNTQYYLNSMKEGEDIYAY